MVSVSTEQFYDGKTLGSCADLAYLVHPVDPNTFLRDYWEKQLLIVRRGDPGYYNDLLTLDDIDHALSLTRVSSECVRVVRDGDEIPLSRLSSGSRFGNILEALYERYRTGSTIVLNALEHRWPTLQHLSRTLGAELSSGVQANIYCTPAGGQGFAPHYDMHDVFVAQVHGTKRWRLCSQPYPLPMHDRPYDKPRSAPQPEHEFDLETGDVLYLPRGTVHWATSNAEASAHITIGIHPVLYADAIRSAITELVAQDVRFRRALPPGFTSDAGLRREAVASLAELLDVVRADLPPEQVIADSAKRAASMGLPALRHHMTDLERLDGITVNTPVRRRPGQRWDIGVGGKAVRLSFHGKSVSLPEDVADEVRFVSGTGPEAFTGAAIPGDLDEPGRVVLVRTLVREGFLTLA